MDSNRFDGLCRVLGAGRSRRRALALLAGMAGLGAGVGLPTRHVPPVSAEAAPCAQFCAEARTSCRKDCIATDADPNLIVFGCLPGGSVETGECRSLCGCAARENEEGSAKEGARFCQVARSTCEERCRAFGGKPSIRCSPPERALVCTCGF